MRLDDSKLSVANACGLFVSMNTRRASGPRPQTRGILLATLLAGVAILVGGVARHAGELRAPNGELRSELEKALVDSRPFRPRLSIAVPHVHCTPTADVMDAACGHLKPRRLPADLFAALRSEDAEGPDGELDHLRGLVPMVANPSQDGYDRSIRQLERALSVAPDDPDLLNDLAVAYGLRGSGTRNPRDLLHALLLVDRAASRDPDAAEPAFNRALFLEWLGLLDSAHLAWRLYLSRFDEPGYQEEASDQLGRIGPGLVRDWSPSRLDQVIDQVRKGSDTAALELAGTDAQRARELGMEQLLGGWGGEWRAGDPSAADRLLAATRALGSEIERRNGECSVSSMVAGIDQAHGDTSRLDRLAAAHVALARGTDLFRTLRSEEAQPQFAVARRIASSDSPVRLWSAMGESGVDFYRHDHAAAAAGFGELIAATEAGCLQALAGRAEWGLGLTRLRQGRYTASLAHFREAERRFRTLDEAENLGAIRTLIGENLALLGQRELAWASWLRAIQALGRYRGSLRLHNVFWTMARAAAEELGPEAALVLQQEGVLNARRSGDPGLVAEARLWRARFRAATGDFGGALGDLDRASQSNRERPAGPAPIQVAADLELARGLVLARSDDPAAVDHLSTALDHYREQGLVLPQPEALLARARILRRLGLPEQALVDLQASLELSRHQRASIADNQLRRSFTEWIQATYEEAIDVLAEDLEASPEKTLRLADEARDVPFLWPAISIPARGGPDDDPLPLLHGRLAEARGAAVLAYTSTPSRLHIWFVHRGGVRSFTRPGERADLERRVRRFVAAVERDASLEDLAAEATRLHRVLLPASVGELPPGTPLVVVPDRTLSALPFDLLREPSTGRLLIEDRPVSLAPSLRFLAASLDPENRLEAPPTAATLIADPAFDTEVFPALPRLARAQGEASRIGELYPDAELLSGPAATPDALRAALDRHPLLHYAGHAVFNPVEPTLSYLTLAPGGIVDGESTVFARDLARHPLRRLRLVVLSACTTLGPTELRTAAISGIARPFLDAGATAVVGTLWPVEDTEAGRFFPEFHRRFLASGDAVEALWQTKLAALRTIDPRQPSSARWAAIQVVGQANF